MPELNTSLTATIHSINTNTAQFTMGSSRTADISITDDDSYELSIVTTQNGIESTGQSITFVVTASPTNTTGNPITGSITYSGSATNGADYIGIPSFSIAHNASVTTLTLRVVNDGTPEAQKTVIANISNINTSGTSNTIMVDSATATIIYAPLLAPTNFAIGYQQTKKLVFTWDSVTNADLSYYKLSENRDGGSGYPTVATTTTTTYTLEVPLYKLVNPGDNNAQYIISSCKADNTCTDGSPTAVTVADLIRSIGYVKASNTDVDDGFGDIITISGDGTTLAVVARSEDSNATGINGDQSNNAATDTGAVYIFTKQAAGWTQTAYIKASNPDDSDFFGTSLDLSDDGTTLVVSSVFEASNAKGINGDQSDNSLYQAGAVYVFNNQSGNWTQTAYIKASNTGDDDEFGLSLSLSGDGTTLAVGAQFESSNATGINGNQSDNSASTSGAVYVFKNQSGNWTQTAYIKASNTDTDDQFSRRLSISDDGTTLAVGAHREDSNATGINGNQSDNSASDSGAVYVFTQDDAGVWRQQAYIKASNPGNQDFFYQVTLNADGTTLAVGARGEGSNATGINGNQNDNSADDSGAVYLY